MKILFIHHGVVLGGAPLSLLYLVRELEKKPDIELEIASHSQEMRDFFSKNIKSPIRSWHNPITFVGRYLIGYIDLNEKNNKKKFWQGLFQFPKSIFKQYKEIKKINPNIIHLNSSVLFSSAFAALLTGIPIVWHVRECLQGNFWQKDFSGWLIRNLASKVIAISQIEATRLGKDTKKNIEVIFNPINFETLNSKLYKPLIEKERLGFKDSDNVVLSLGGVTPRKGTLEQIMAMQYTDENVKLIIAGTPLENYPEGDYKHQIVDALSKLPAEKVKFTGIVENVGPLLAASDLLIFTGMKPHFPRPVFEAWYMEKPVIVFEMEGISNNINHNVDGIIVKELSSEALGKAINALFHKPDLMMEMGKYGRKKTEEKCNPISIAGQVLQIYKTILN